MILSLHKKTIEDINNKSEIIYSLFYCGREDIIVCPFFIEMLTDKNPNYIKLYISKNNNGGKKFPFSTCNISNNLLLFYIEYNGELKLIGNKKFNLLLNELIENDKSANNINLYFKSV